MQVVEQSEAFVQIDGELEFHCTKIILKNSKDEYFYTTTSQRLIDPSSINLEGLNLVPIPADDVWPNFSAHFTSAPEPLPPSSYVKQPSLLHYGDTKLQYSTHTQREAASLSAHRILKHAH